MARRRGNGEGTVFQRADGRWEAAAYVRQPDGTRRRVYRYSGSRQAGMDQLAVLRDRDARMAPLSVDSRTTVGEYLTMWLEQVAVHAIRPTTWISYRHAVQRYLIPGLGRRRLAHLSAKEVRVWLAEVANTCQCCRQHIDARRAIGKRRCCAVGQCCGRRVAPSTLRYLRALLSSALAHAVREDELPRNVVAAVRLPVPGRSTFTPLTADEARRVLGAAAEHPLHALFELAIRVGLRRGELLGLRWADLDETAGLLTVRQSVQRRRDTGAIIVLPAKTAASHRRIPIPAEALQALAEHRHRQAVQREAAGSRWSDSGLIFTHRLGGPLDPGVVNRAFAGICDQAGVRRARFHLLRHTCASLLLEQGVELVTISHLLGHSRLGVTADVYTHVRLRLQRAAVDALGTALNPEPTGGADGRNDDPPLAVAA